jgi:flagellar basal body-associated protein FliL
MRGRTESKTREADQEKRQTSGWTSIGFAIVLVAAVIAILLLILG